ncbi:hypothetical protein TWF730_001656 [Orbilia blumenaviensis]|uniref:Uncharacterized protein n=1 Tax=Orbilia blumenaviensis TaxID=1796055 RepID=A0AAV9UKG5_9PEZI
MYPGDFYPPDPELYGMDGGPPYGPSPFIGPDPFIGLPPHLRYAHPRSPMHPYQGRFRTPPPGGLFPPDDLYDEYPDPPSPHGFGGGRDPGYPGGPPFEYEHRGRSRPQMHMPPQHSPGRRGGHPQMFVPEYDEDAAYRRNRARTPGATDRAYRRAQTPGATDQAYRRARTPGATDRDRRRAQTPGATGRDRRRAQTPGATDRDRRRARTPGATDQSYRRARTPGPDSARDRQRTPRGEHGHVNGRPFNIAVHNTLPHTLRLKNVNVVRPDTVQTVEPGAPKQIATIPNLGVRYEYKWRDGQESYEVILDCPRLGTGGPTAFFRGRNCDTRYTSHVVSRNNCIMFFVMPFGTEPIWND